MDNVRVIPDAGDAETVGADTIAKLSAQTSEDRPVAAWDQRIVIHLGMPLVTALCGMQSSGYLPVLWDAIRK